MFVDLHTLTSFPFSALNRGDSNDLKDMNFGGARRHRISSQCLKRARREEMREHDYPVGKRTKYILHELTTRLVRLGRDAEAATLVARAGLEAVGFGWSKDRPELTEYLLFLGADEFDDLAHALHRAEVWDALYASPAAAGAGKKERRSASGTREAAEALIDVLGRPAQSHDVALFGRMIADRPEVGVDGAVSVDHAFTVHHAVDELDWFTAVDDLAPADSAGAGHLDLASFACGLFYSFTSVCVPQLHINLGHRPDATRAALRGYLAASIHAVPSGKQHATAAYVRPALVLAVARTAPLNLCNAFLRPVRASEAEGDLLQAAARRLPSHWSDQAAMYGSADIREAICTAADALETPAGVLRVSAETLLDAAVAMSIPVDEG